MTFPLEPEKGWELLRSETGPSLILFQARFDWVRNPRSGKSMKAIILEASDSVNVVALTAGGKIVVVRQYRFGVGQITVEIPAGLVEPGETPEQAVRRELEEETGYTSANWKYLGSVQTNPAFLNNHCHQWLAVDAVKTRPTQLDEHEEIDVGELSLDQVKQEIKAGRMRNALTLLCLSQVFDMRDEAEQKR